MSALLRRLRHGLVRPLLQLHIARRPDDFDGRERLWQLHEALRDAEHKARTVYYFDPSRHELTLGATGIVIIVHHALQLLP